MKCILISKSLNTVTGTYQRSEEEFSSKELALKARRERAQSTIQKLGKAPADMIADGDSLTLCYVEWVFGWLIQESRSKWFR